MKNNKGIVAILIVLIIIGVLALGGGTYYFLVKKTQKPVGCTQEAKICPDGSAVSRTGPNCGFAACPTVKTDETVNWKTFTAIDKGATFRYPENLSTAYIRPQEWPPRVLIIDNTGFSCEEGGLGIGDRPGMAIQKEINNTVYCIESVSEGTAGTFYTNYTYSFLKDNKLVKLEFVLAYPQCGNYEDPQKTECEQERQTFDLDTLINLIAESVQL